MTALVPTPVLCRTKRYTVTCQQKLVNPPLRRLPRHPPSRHARTSQQTMGPAGADEANSSQLFTEHERGCGTCKADTRTGGRL